MIGALVRASALALRKHPRMAARWDEDALVPASAVDIGVAVALDDGLATPVLRRADEKDLMVISGEVEELASRAREGRLADAEREGAVFSVTNLGM